MKSVLEIYKIGMGPDSALNIVPYRACNEIYKMIQLSQQKVHHIEIDLYNEYARLGKYTQVYEDIAAAFEGASFPFEVKYDLPTPPAARSPYTFDVLIYISKDEVIARHRVVSISGGNYMITDQIKPPKYQFQSFQEMIDFFKKNKMSYFEFCCLFDKKEDIVNHFDQCIKLMDGLIDRGLKHTGEIKTVDPSISYDRRAKIIFEAVSKNESQAQRMTRIITAYSYAIGEEVPEKCMMVACPTCSSTSIVWSTLRYIRENYKNITNEKIYNAMCAAGLITSYIQDRASLAASQIGCQGPVGTATGIATCIIANLLYGADMEEMGRAFEMAYEHCLGLICDSVCPLPIVPCIQRCAAYSTRAMDLAVLNHSLMATEELCKLEDVIKVLHDTGKDLDSSNKRLAIGGFHEHALYTIEPWVGDDIVAEENESKKPTQTSKKSVKKGAKK